MKEKVVLVDREDKEIGIEEKIKAHEEGKLHRAFSIFVFNLKNELLIQKIAKSKYHSGGLWANTCCGHPTPGEDILEVAHRRLQEEMGFDCDLKEIDTFIYKEKMPNGLYEHELDHIFIGYHNGEVEHDPKEVDEHKWMSLESLKEELEIRVEKYTAWFEPAFEIVIQAMEDL